MYPYPTGIASLTAILVFAAGAAAECRQEHAVYADGKGAYELAFAPVGSDAAATSHRFTMTIATGGTVLDGIVMPGERSNGMVFHDCPEGDVTGEEIAACTVWEGVVYALDGKGGADLLPAEDADAANTLLLAGFGPALRYSRLWDEGKATTEPWDVFTMKGCTP